MDRRREEGSRWPAHGDDEHTATTFQLRHDPDRPKTERQSRFDAGDRVLYPLGKGVVTWLDEETGDCLVRPMLTVRVEGKHVDGSAVVTVNGKPLAWAKSLKVVNHSPTGPEFGYRGSGPAQMAAAVMLQAGLPVEVVLDKYQPFKDAVIANLKDGFSIVVEFKNDGDWIVK